MKLAFMTCSMWLVTLTVSLASIVWSDHDADIIILGEIHDNPRHHQRQANAINEIVPKAVVFEMLTTAEADALNSVERTPVAMQDASVGFHWDNITDYVEVFAGSPVIIGAALPRSDVRDAFKTGAAGVFGSDSFAFGLKTPLPLPELTARKEAQFSAHCDAMPMEMMGGMVEAQRLRDAHFARVVLQAFERHGGPIVLITGNGHARMDWGVPRFLTRVEPDLTVLSLGQGEGGKPPSGVFSLTVDDAPAPTREDPCAAFK